MEMDLFVNYAFPFGLSLGMTNYYFPPSKFFDHSASTGSHAYEFNASYKISGFYAAGNYIFNEAGSAGSKGDDKYFEVGYDFKNIRLFAGAGDGWHTPNGSFQVVNIGLSVTRDIQITDSFKLPLKGSAILNPATEQYYLTIGLSL